MTTKSRYAIKQRNQTKSIQTKWSMDYLTTSYHDSN